MLLKRINPRPSSRAHAICTGPFEKAPSPTRWNTAGGSVGGICLRTTLSKDSVRVSHLCALAGRSSALARGKRGHQPNHDQASSCPYNFISHEARPVLIDRDENMLAVDARYSAWLQARRHADPPTRRSADTASFVTADTPRCAS